MDKAAFVVLCRDHERYVRWACQSVLAQRCPPMQIFLSNQGSVDRTPEIIHELADRYKGPHEVKVIECPVTEPRGMNGCNAHLDWLFTHTDAELLLVNTDNDWAHPERATKTIEAFEQTKADYVCTGMIFSGPDGDFKNAHPSEDKMCSSQEILTDQIGGSTSMALRKSFYARIGKLPPVIQNDVYLPFLATLMNGCYYIHDALEQYIRQADPNNTGLGGQMLAADETRKEQLLELQYYQSSATWYMLIDKMIELKVGTEELCALLGSIAFHTAKAWMHQRTKLTDRRLSPLPLPA